MRSSARTVSEGDPGASAAVIDANVALKWVIPERGSDAAVALRERLARSGTPVYVPDLFWAETANVLWRLTRTRGTRLAAIEAQELLEILWTAPLVTDPVRPVSGRALEIACATGATAYDAAYVAVAELRAARLWTAHEGLVRSLAGSEWAERVSSL